MKYYFQIRNKKKHYIIISRVIISHMGAMCIQTPYIIISSYYQSHGCHVYLDTLYYYQQSYQQSHGCHMYLDTLYFDLARELKTLWSIRVTELYAQNCPWTRSRIKIGLKAPEESWRHQETCCHSSSKEFSPANAGVKNSQQAKNTTTTTTNNNNNNMDQRRT